MAAPDDEPPDGPEPDGPEPDGEAVGGPVAAEAPRVPIRTIFRRFWPYTRPFRGRMIVGLLLTGAVPALTTVSIWLFKVLVDDVLTPADYRLFPTIAAAYLGLTVLIGLVGFVDEYLSAWTAERFVLGLRVRLFDHLGRLSTGYLDRRPLGDVLSRISGDTAEIEQLVLTGVNLFLTYSFQVVFYATAMAILDWKLTLIAFVAAPAFLLLSKFLTSRIAAAAREQRRRSGSIVSVAEESLGNAALVQAYDRQDSETERFRSENEASFRAQMRATRLESFFSPVGSLVQAIGVLLVVGVAVAQIADGRITLGGLLVFLTYLSQLYGPISGFGSLANSLFAAGASAERIIEVLDTRPDVTEPDDPQPLPRAAGALVVEGVDFRYPDTERPALQGVTFAIPPGGRVAIVGASGAGKSTLARLLLRQYDPGGGRITLDGHDLRRLPLADLRRNVTAVLQDVLVFDGTIAENIRWAHPDASAEQVEAAARAADLHDTVVAFPDGYRTRVGQRGRMLSGGQCRRLAIARAMIRDAPVLVLDEPTTGLDAASTERVLAPLRRLSHSRTTVTISHQLLTVSDADQILYMEHGRIAAAGTHTELLHDSPGYAELYRLHRSEASDGSAPDGTGETGGATAAVDDAPTRVLPAVGPRRRARHRAPGADGPFPSVPGPSVPGPTVPVLPVPVPPAPVRGRHHAPAHLPPAHVPPARAAADLPAARAAPEPEHRRDGTPEYPTFTATAAAALHIPVQTGDPFAGR
ncbi:ABC transporter ATP-binding protein [Pseudonocardia sediminis]|uniref:ABC transporter ATP-binding protein n=1 Tax=Pseudonocardia sediminis TaxID=1397368 RepID=UPI001028C8F3|nr:ABC transporter ATP-binding protein [Pseudonocardia sediminis]